MSQNVQNLGMEKLKTVLKFKIDLGMALDKALVGGIQLADAGLFLGVLMNLKDVIDSAKGGIKHIADLDAEESKELKEFVKNNMQLRDEEVEAFINDAFATALNANQFAQQAIQIYKTFQAMRKS